MRSRVFSMVALTLFLLTACGFSGCRRNRNGDTFLIALGDNIRTIDPIGSPSVDAASERVRTLMFNSLVKKDDKFDYIGDLAANIQRSADGLTYTFTLHDGVKFHDGRVLTSADAKYTLDLVFTSDFAKSASFYDNTVGMTSPPKGTPAKKKSYIARVDAPDPRTIIVTLTKPWNGLLPNLVPVAIIPRDSYESQKTHPLGTGPFKFVRYDSSQQVLDLEAHREYWEGGAAIQKVRVRVVSDMNQLQAELRAGRVDLAPLPTSLSPDAVNLLAKDPNLQVKQFAGSNLVLLTFNTSQPPLNDVRVRQAIAYAVHREGLIRDLQLGQGKLAHSILPEDSWAYTTGQKYSFDPALAKRLLDEAGFKDPDGDGPQMRFDNKPLVFKISGSSLTARNCAGVIYGYLKNVGINVSIETSEQNALFDQLRYGQFQIAYGQWVGGNQDPIFYKDLFATSEIPTQQRASRNRSRYSNPALDSLLEEAVNTFDRPKALALYTKIQAIVSAEVPVLPLWYQANIIIARKNVGNIQVNASGDWGFVRNLTVK